MKYAINAHGFPDAMGSSSQGTTAGRFVFISGQIALDKVDPECLVAGGIEDQTNRVIDLVEQLLAEVGCQLSDVAQTTVYLAHMEDFAAMDAVYAERFGRPAPARSVVEVSKLPLDALIEMDCVACR